MAQEYFINSQQLQSKVDSLLPSQGGAGAGFDLSASTQIIPVIDLTESAEGSQLRQDLQTAFGFASDFNRVNNGTTTLVTTTGFFRVFGVSIRGNVADGSNIIFIDDGATTKTIFSDTIGTNSVSIAPNGITFDFNVFLRAGDSLKATSSATLMDLNVTTRQIASIDGTLTNPLGFS
jgi:hypothetical protein